MHSPGRIPGFEQDGTLQVQHRRQLHASQPIGQQGQPEQVCHDFRIYD